MFFFVTVHSFKKRLWVGLEGWDQRLKISFKCNIVTEIVIFLYISVLYVALFIFSINGYVYVLGIVGDLKCFSRMVKGQLCKYLYDIKDSKIFCVLLAVKTYLTVKKYV